MPIYEFVCNGCGHEWEDFFQKSDPMPEDCPTCNVNGKVQRVMSAPSLGKVELTGHELRQSLKAEGKKMAKEIGTSEKKLSNFVGESTYQAKQVAIDKSK